ncbi:hypothetical protein M3Y99_00192800 [Aphelenchoides fujianensis]|nr:hypothetical protein M3Y99_00192800 [Aphelenchoides fujianensis]
MNTRLVLIATVFCMAALSTSFAQDQNDEDDLAMAMDKRYRQFAFAKRFDAFGHAYGLDKRSVGAEDAADEPADGLEAQKRARFAFAKRARFAFAKRARFAFA